MREVSGLKLVLSLLRPEFPSVTSQLRNVSAGDVRVAAIPGGRAVGGHYQLAQRQLFVVDVWGHGVAETDTLARQVMAALHEQQHNGSPELGYLTGIEDVTFPGFVSSDVEDQELIQYSGTVRLTVSR